jgi:hypothetical protein
MDRSDFHLYVLEIAVFVGIIGFLVLIRNMETMQVLNSYGVPLLIYIVIFAAYPIYKMIKKK